MGEMGMKQGVNTPERRYRYWAVLAALAAAAGMIVWLGVTRMRRWNYHEHWDDPRWFATRVGWILAFAVILALLVGAMAATVTAVKRRETRRQTEELTQALRQERQASRAKSQFLSAMSYDIRTPMNAIVGMTTIALQHQDDAQRVRHCLGEIDKASHYLLDLVNDVLDISEIERGATTLSPSVISLPLAVETVTRMVRAQFQNKTLDFRLEVREMEHPYLYADEVRLEQIFGNLLTNAMQYTPSGGRVTVELYELPGIAPEHARVVYRVQDTGVGMSPEFMETMYDPFARAEDDRDGGLQGSGLGLVIVRQMVERLGGTIQCQSQTGEGTEFVVTLELPIAKELPGQGSETDQARWTAFQGLRVLVAEDNELNWEVIRQLLEGQGVEVRRAADGQACVDRLTAEGEDAYQLVLMDVQMPVMDGMEATAAIRSDPRSWVNNIPIVAMTADAMSQDVAQCRQVGMDDHVAKPVELEKLRQAMERAISKRGART